MMRTIQKFFARLCMACVFAAVFAPVVTAQVAPRISTSRAGDYARLNFSWPNATTMNVAPSGKSVQVTFSNPVGADVGAAAKQLAPYVNGIIRSPDGKTITLNLNQAYRVRHFVSGNNTGLDILTRTPVTESPAVVPPPQPTTTTPAVAPFKVAPATPKPPILATKPPTITAPAPQKPKPEIPVIPKQVPATAASAPAAAPAPSKPLTQIKPRDNAVLSTKKTVAPEPKPIPQAPTPEASTEEAPKPVVAPASAPTVNTTPETSAPASESQTPETPKAASPEATPNGASEKTTTEKPAEAATPSSDKPQGALAIGIVPGDEGVTFEFPWSSRTAFASFARGSDVWLVFDRPSTIDMARLSAIVPSSITSVKSFALPGHTILRFATREPLYPHATAERGTYRWRVQLKKAPPSPLNDTEIYPNQDEAGVSIVFKLFDVANPISFYDPTLGDRWVLAPTYESGRGVSTNYTYPGFTILQTSQGLVIRTDDDALTLTRTRAGLRLAREGGLAVSDKLPFLPGQRSVGQLNALSQNVVLAYDKYFLPEASMAQMRQDIMQRLTHAVDDTARADLLRQLAGMYVAQGYGPEASTILNDIRTLYSEYYAKEKLAILHMAAAFMADRMAEAAYYANEPSIVNDKEAQLWRDVIGLFVPIAPPPAPTTPKPAEEGASPTPEPVVVTPAPADFKYLKYHPDYLQYYPPRVRQKLSIIGADRYLQLGDAKSAIKVFDILNEDGILKPIQPYAEYLFGKVAADHEKYEQALKTWQRLIDENSDTYITARARFSSIALKYSQGIIPIEEAIKQLNGVRLAWRGDSLERELLHYLGQLYMDNKQYDEALRTWKELQIAFPNDPETLETSTRMATLFEQLYNDGLADEMKPLQSLALFYEFRNLTPVGARGDAMIQKLADRLASVDLLDRAIQLLEHQVKSRTEGLDRARVGARLALLYLIDNKPKRALLALENSNYGSMSEELQILRTQLNAQALAKQKKEAEALAVLRDDTSPRGEQLKLEILWQMQDWPSIINQAEDMLALRKDLTAELTQQEQEMLIQLALAYSFEKDYTQLSYLRDYYMNLIPKDSAYKSTFEYLTNDTTPLDTEDVALLSGQISRTQNFLKNFRDAIASGKLSEATKQ